LLQTQTLVSFCILAIDGINHGLDSPLALSLLLPADPSPSTLDHDRKSLNTTVHAVLLQYDHTSFALFSDLYMMVPPDPPLAAPPSAANGSLALGLPPADAYTPANLPPESISRYSRQLLLPVFGPTRQIALSSSRALIIGCGGLGCPAALYLGAAGVGHLALADRPGDVVEVTNLHRQVGHTTDRVGVEKAESLAIAVRAINPLVNVTVVDGSAFAGGDRPGGATAEALVAAYDVVLDCTDNVAARYLINDACVLGGVPLVAGAAVGTDGQLTVYNWEASAVDVARPPTGSPATPVVGTLLPPRKSSRVCLRCVFPVPPPPSCVGSCDTAGVLGPVPGVIGVLQALEAIKVLATPAAVAAAPDDPAAPAPGVPLPPSGAAAAAGLTVLARRMLLFDGADGAFTTVTLRPARPDCAVCSPARTVTSTAGVDYAAWARGKPRAATAAPPVAVAAEGAAAAVPRSTDVDTASGAPAAPAGSCSVVPFQPSALPPHLPPAWRLPADAFAATYFTPAGAAATLLVDVRPAAQYQLCAVPGSVNVPVDGFAAAVPDLATRLIGGKDAGEGAAAMRRMVIVCRRGNQSRVAVAAARGAGVEAVDIIGGLAAWPGFPAY